MRSAILSAYGGFNMKYDFIGFVDTISHSWSSYWSFKVLLDETVTLLATLAGIRTGKGAWPWRRCGVSLRLSSMAMGSKIVPGV